MGSVAAAAADSGTTAATKTTIRHHHTVTYVPILKVGFHFLNPLNNWWYELPTHTIICPFQPHNQFTKHVIWGRGTRGTIRKKIQEKGSERKKTRKAATNLTKQSHHSITTRCLQHQRSNIVISIEIKSYSLHSTGTVELLRSNSGNIFRLKDVHQPLYFSYL